MFEFLGMAGNYEQRKVDRYDGDGLMVSTAAVNDSSKPYETAVKHVDYNDDKHVIVELYDTKEEAQKGHDKWVATMTADALPNKLIDVSTSSVFELADAFGVDVERTFKKAD
jgi:hypothetical protein